MVPEQVRVLVHKHRPIDVGRTADRLLQALMESLEEEHGNPEEPAPFDDSQRLAARAFVRGVAQRFRLYQCDPTGQSFMADARLEMRRQDAGPA